ncbi:MAG: hypothetical protein ABSG53_28955 [Thermoguttaceae bacterium]|jgi:hypothetical protein
MTKYVEFHRLDEYEGRVTLGDDGVLRVSAPSLESLLSRPIIADDGSTVDPSEAPDKFIENLYVEYHNPYFCAGKAQTPDAQRTAHIYSPRPADPSQARFFEPMVREEGRMPVLDGREMLRRCLAAAIGRLRSHAEPARIDIADVDEKAFRFFVLAEIKRLDPGAICQPEWKTIDLVVTTSTGRNIAIEFKFYVLRRTYPLNSDRNARPRWKGGAGKNNFRNFATCVRKLCDLQEGIHERYLVLVHDRKEYTRKAGFEASYGRLLREDFRVENCWGDDVACWLIPVDEKLMGATTPRATTDSLLCPPSKNT